MSDAHLHSIVTKLKRKEHGADHIASGRGKDDVRNSDSCFEAALIFAEEHMHIKLSQEDHHPQIPPVFQQNNDYKNIRKSVI